MVATKVELSSGEQVQGTLPIGNGGTGATTLAGAGIEQTSNKNAISGYAGLNASGYVAPAQLGSGGASVASVLAGNNTWLTLARNVVPESVVVSSATSLTLTNANTHYVFTGSVATTWTLPAVSGNNGFHLVLENRGSAAITLQRAGTDQIWFLSALTAVTIAAGGSMHVICDGTYWNTLSTDLANNNAGILPVANGGTGLANRGPTLTSVTSSATPGVTVTGDDFLAITALAVAVTGVTVTGTPGTGWRLMIQWKDNGTARAITHGTSFVASGVASPITTTVVGKTVREGYVYDATAAKWVCMAVDSSGF